MRNIIFLMITFLCLQCITFAQYKSNPKQDLPLETALLTTIQEDMPEDKTVYAGIVGGVSYLGGRKMSNLHPDDREFINKLKTGMNFKADLSFSTKYNFRLGARYNYFNSSAGFGNIFTDKDSIDIYSHLETIITTSFISTFTELRIKKSSYSTFVFDFGLGLMFTKENNYLRSDIVGMDLIRKTKAIGISAGFAYEIWPQDYWALILKADLISGIPWEFNNSYINEIFKTSAINLSRAELGVGIRFVL